MQHAHASEPCILNQGAVNAVTSGKNGTFVYVGHVLHVWILCPSNRHRQGTPGEPFRPHFRPWKCQRILTRYCYQIRPRSAAVIGFCLVTYVLAQCVKHNFFNPWLHVAQQTELHSHCSDTW